VRVAAALSASPVLLCLLVSDRRTSGASTLASKGLSLLAGSAALGAALSQVWPTDRMINAVLLAAGFSLAGLAWLGGRRPVWRPVLVTLLSAWIVMSDVKGAIAISVIAGYLVLVAPDVQVPDRRPLVAIVDDDASIREATHNLLDAAGFATVFVTRPLSLVFIVATVLILVAMVVPAIRRRREAIAD